MLERNSDTSNTSNPAGIELNNAMIERGPRSFRDPFLAVIANQDVLILRSFGSCLACRLIDVRGARGGSQVAAFNFVPARVCPNARQLHCHQVELIPRRFL
jgi:hypothetical protein